MEEIQPSHFIEAFRDQALLLNEATQVLTEFLRNLFGFFGEIECVGNQNAQKRKENIKNYQTALELSRNLSEYIDKLHEEIPALVETTKESDAKVKDYEQHIDLLKKELEKVENQLVQAKERELEEKKEASCQSQFTSAMGNVMGTMLWKTSKSEDTIETFISTGTISEFIIMSNVTINSFMESYTEELPMLESNEYKFAMSIIGTNINITAQRSGRNFYLDDKIGISFVHNMLEHLGSFLVPSGLLLKRMTLIFIYNLSICKRGAMLIQMSKNGIGNILKCLGAENTSEIQTLALTLINSMLEEIPTKEFCQQVVKNTPRQDLQRLMTLDDDDLNHVSKMFHSKILAFESNLS